MSPFQGSFIVCHSGPRALPWADIFGPFRADSKKLTSWKRTLIHPSRCAKEHSKFKKTLPNSAYRGLKHLCSPHVVCSWRSAHHRRVGSVSVLPVQVFAIRSPLVQMPLVFQTTARVFTVSRWPIEARPLRCRSRHARTRFSAGSRSK